ALTQVRFIPAGQPAHRIPPRASATHRLEMVRRAIAGNSRFTLDEREIHRHAPSYSVDTLISLRAELPADTPLILFMGADAFMGLASWHRWETLLSLAHLAVAWRPGFPAADIEKHCPAALSDVLIRHRCIESALLQQTPAGCVFLHPITQLDISASQIRAAARHGRSVRYLVPDPVLDYLNENCLYD
ncbi:MAG: nicotinate-nucleotide adenylyltransferase, partial [Sulfuricella sp.]|nr:nicotinate-nucleotide adenylyltransferase [Sulfuricella sp.]